MGGPGSGSGIRDVLGFSCHGFVVVGHAVEQVVGLGVASYPPYAWDASFLPQTSITPNPTPWKPIPRGCLRDDGLGKWTMEGCDDGP